MNVDRAKGALLGLAVGDALGTTLEFTTPARGGFPALLDGPHRDITGGGPFHVAPGQVTDDTHMACCLAASLRAHGALDLADLARRYVDWRQVAFDIGHTTASAIALLATGDLAAGRRTWEDGRRSGAANGSLMRTAPIGVFFCKDDDARRDASLAESALTHFDPRCQIACSAFTAVIAAHATHAGLSRTHGMDLADEEIALAGKVLFAEPSIQDAVLEAQSDLREDLRLARDDDAELDGLIHASQGFVRVAFRLAFWEYFHAPTFEAGLIDVVNRGGDADTNGAIAGALLGARDGAATIPHAWRERVLGALQDGPASPFRDAYHPKVLLDMLDRMQGSGKD